MPMFATLVTAADGHSLSRRFPGKLGSDVLSSVLGSVSGGCFVVIAELFWGFCAICTHNI